MSVLLAAAVIGVLPGGSTAADQARLKRTFSVFARDTGAETPGIPDLPRFDAAVNAVLSDGHGGWYVAGWFPSPTGLARLCPNLVHLLPDHRFDQGFCPAPDGAVFALAGTGNRLFVGGTFTRVGGEPRRYLASLDPDTGNATPWDPRMQLVKPRLDDRNETPIQGGVLALVPSGRRLYAWGEFDRVTGTKRLGLARFDSVSGGLDRWAVRADLRSGGLDDLARLRAPIAVGGGHVFLAKPGYGSVYVVDARTAALKTFTRLVATGEPLTPHVAALALRRGTLYVGGEFSRVQGERRRGLVALNAATAKVEDWPPPVAGWVSALELNGSSLFVGGSFTAVGGTRRQSLAALDLARRQLLPWKPVGPAPGFGVVADIAAADGGIAVGCAWCS